MSVQGDTPQHATPHPKAPTTITITIAVGQLFGQPWDPYACVLCNVPIPDDPESQLAHLIGHGAIPQTMSTRPSEPGGDQVGNPKTPITQPHPAGDRCYDCATDTELEAALSGKLHPTIHFGTGTGVPCPFENTAVTW